MRMELLAQPGVGFVADDNRCTIIVMRRFKNFGDQIFALIQQDKMRFNLGVRQKDLAAELLRFAREVRLLAVRE